MRWFRKKNPVAEAESLIEKHKKRIPPSKGDALVVVRLLREIKGSNLPEARKNEIRRELSDLLEAHRNFAQEFFRFQEWAKSRNKGKMPRGLKLKKMELEWMMEYGKD